MNIRLKKPRSHAKLKNLPEKRQRAILDYLSRHDHAETLQWLAKSGIHVSDSTLRGWRAWYFQRKEFLEMETASLGLLLNYKERHPGLTKKAMDEMGEFIFNAMALARRDVKTWSMAQNVQLKREHLAMERKKLELELQKYKDQVQASRQTVNDPEMSPEEKQERIRQILGTE